MEKFPKYTGHQVFCTEKAQFKDVDIGNLFFLVDMLCVRMNYPHRRQMARNTCVIVADDPGLCGMGLYTDGEDEVYVVVESTVTLRGAQLVLCPLN